MAAEPLPPFAFPPCLSTLTLMVGGAADMAGWAMDTPSVSASPPAVPNRMRRPIFLIGVFLLSFANLCVLFSSQWDHCATMGFLPI